MMLLSDFFQKRREQRIADARAEGIAQGRKEGETKILNAFAKQIASAKGDPEKELEIAIAFIDQLEKSIAKRKENYNG